MPDITTIAAAFPAIAKIVDKLTDKTVKVELQSKIIELQSHVMAMQSELQQYRLAEGKDQRQAELRKTIEKLNNAYYVKGANTPYCISCFETKAMLIPVVRVEYSVNGECPTCKAIYAEVYGFSPPRTSFTPI